MTTTGWRPRIGLLIPTSEPHVFDDPHPGRRIVDLARRAEAAGFDSLWAGESLTNPRFEPLAVLTALATTTDRVSLGTAALIPACRQPVATAQQLATIDRLTDGRLIVGVGAGYPSPNTKAAFEIAGAPYRRRATLLDDIVALWRSMFAEQAGQLPGEFHGEILRLRDLPPVTVQRPGGPPIWLASATESALERIGRSYDGWLPYLRDADDYRDAQPLIHRVDGSAIDSALFVTILIDDDPERARVELDQYCHATYGLPLTIVESIQLILYGPRDDVRAALKRFSDGGCTHFVVRMGTLSDPDHIDRIADALITDRTAPTTFRDVRTPPFGVPPRRPSRR